MKILIVEDDSFLAGQLQAQLSELGYTEVAVANNDKVAEELFMTFEPDLAVLDIGLRESDRNGIELAKDFQSRQRLPIIFLSAYSDAQTLSQIQKISFSNYLVKPCSTRQLFVAIETAMNQFIAIKDLNYFSEPATACPLVDWPTYFFVKDSKNKYVRVEVSHVSWVQAVRGGVEIHTIHEMKHILTASLISFSKQFLHPDLIRVHRSYMVNRKHVVAIVDQCLEVRTEKRTHAIPFSKTYLPHVQKAFKKLRSD